MIDLGLGWLWAIGAGVIALLATWLGGRKSAKTDVKLKAQADTIKAHEVRNEVENRVAIDRGGAPVDRLRERWGRD